MPPAEPQYRFASFLLDPVNRQLWHEGAEVDLNARYFDALVLLVRTHGQLVEKDRFFDEVWGDVVVSDSALTQCIKDIRKALGDDASDPRYIQTVPRHGYRFVAPVEKVDPAEPVPSGEPAVPARGGAIRSDDDGEAEPRRSPAQPHRSRVAPFADALVTLMRWGGAGALGGGFAGILGGLLYGTALAYTPAGPALGTASVLVVLLALNALVGTVGGAAVAAGMAAWTLAWRGAAAWSVVGGALGGLVVGGVARLLGLDAFALLFGTAPAGITGGLEGAALGAALAGGALLGERFGGRSYRSAAGGAGLMGAVAGVAIPLLGGRLMGGSLDQLARSFDESRLHLDALGRFFGEVHFGLTSQAALGGIEGLLFGASVAAALTLIARDRP